MHFAILRTPRLDIGEGCFSRLPASVAAMGASRAMVLTGRHFLTSPEMDFLESDFLSNGVAFVCGTVTGEPSPELVDGLAGEARQKGCEAIVAIGGGSVLDAGKAVSQAVFLEEPIVSYLESVGTREPDGRRLPLVCVPTTAGTGSEATKNAVLSKAGPGGFKKSLRHDNLVPDRVFLDPLLQRSCPPDVTAASGMDAITQLLEAYLSTQANPFTDALALEGLGAAGRSLEDAFRDGENTAARAGMAWAAYLSGIVLANAGLGAVHGMAGALGGMCPIPHGVACGTLLVPTMRMLVRKAMLRGDGVGVRFLARCARASRALGARDRGGSGFGVATGGSGNDPESRAAVDLVRMLEGWESAFDFPGLSRFGVGEEQLLASARLGGNKSAALDLSPPEMEEIMRSRLERRT